MTLSVRSAAAALASALFATAAAHAAPGTFTVFDDIPMFGLYTSEPPNYTPPPGVILLNNGTRYAKKLTAAQRRMIGADLKANVTYHAQCDNYDRLGSLIMAVTPVGVLPDPADPVIEIARWITPFSNYTRGQYATYNFPPADLSAFAGVMTNRAVDIWIGIDGGSNPYTGDPCTDLRDTDPDFGAVGFRYSVSLSSTTPAPAAKSGVSAPVPYLDYTAVPVNGTSPSGKTGTGKAVVIVSGHGSETGGNEYKNTTDTLTVNGVAVGSFSTKVDCSSYRRFSPDGNPLLFLFNNSSNPRNWCPGAIVPTRVFPVTLEAENSVSLNMNDPRVPAGSYYRTSITLIPD